MANSLTDTGDWLIVAVLPPGPMTDRGEPLSLASGEALAPEARVNGVSPGAILWPDDGESFPVAERERITRQTPLRRTGTPEDIAGAVKYLLLDAPFVTGQVFAVDGGRSITL